MVRKNLKTATVRLQSWSDFANILKIMGRDLWLYRGQEDATWPLMSGLDRQMQKLTETHPEFDKSSFAFTLPRAELFAISRFKELAKAYQVCESDAAALVAMQHYGAKTRLLDFTTSIMVALFFAYETRATGKDRAIYAVDYRTLVNQGGLWGDYQQFLKKKVQKDGIEEERIWWNLESPIENAYFQQFVFEKATKAIWSSKIGMRSGILPLYTAGLNGRQTAQAGVELMPLTFDGFAKNLAATFCTTETEVENPSFHMTCDNFVVSFINSHPSFQLVKFVFDASMEDDAWQILDQANINASMLYPDLVGIAKSVRYNERILGIDRKEELTKASGVFSKLENAISNKFPLWDRKDPIGFLHSQEVTDIDLDRLKQLYSEYDGSGLKGSILSKSGSKSLDQTEIQFIDDAILKISNIVTVEDIWIPVRKVFTCNIDSLLVEVVDTMISNCFSHVPVLDKQGRVSGVFSESTMLEASMSDLNNRNATTIGDIEAFLPIGKHKADVFRFVSKSDTIIRLRHLFEEALQEHKRIGMIFVTENGQLDEPLLGILTVWDVAGVQDFLKHGGER